jgi:hypothetical protein
MAEQIGLVACHNAAPSSILNLMLKDHAKRDSTVILNLFQDPFRRTEQERAGGPKKVTNGQSMLAIGLMSGTSRDGIDAALIETDGEGVSKGMAFHAMSYTDGFRLRLAEACSRAMAMENPGFEPLIRSVEEELTELHVEAVSDLLARSGHITDDVAVIGFHGHTVAHRPEWRWTWQIGDALALAGAPRLILFDEPAAGLSPTERSELVEILTNMPRHIGYIIIEHDMDVALRVAERVSMMHNGRVFKEGPPEEIESDPEVQELYLGGGHG